MATVYYREQPNIFRITKTDLKNALKLVEQNNNFSLKENFQQILNNLDASLKFSQCEVISEQEFKVHYHINSLYSNFHHMEIIFKEGKYNLAVWGETVTPLFTSESKIELLADWIKMLSCIEDKTSSIDEFDA